MDKAYEQFVAAVRCFLHGGIEPALKELSDDEIKQLYQISYKYDLAHIAYFALKKHGYDQKQLAKFTDAFYKAVIRRENLAYDFDQIRKAFDGAGIRYLPLKGVVIQKYYKEPFYRTCGDLDILVDENQIDRAESTLKKSLKYKCVGGGKHDRTYVTSSNGLLELHFTLVGSGAGANTIHELARVWDNAEPIGEGLAWQMKPEFFLFYHVSHMAKHFAGGSLGFRPFVDLFILERNLKYDKAAFNKLLEKTGLTVFFENVSRLASVWFDGGEYDQTIRRIEEYVFNGGAFGNYELRLSVSKNLRGGKRSGVLSRIFLPYSQLKGYYPSLEKFKILLPLYEVRRWFRLFSRKKRTSSLRSIKMDKIVSDKAGKELTEFCKSLGL